MKHLAITYIGNAGVQRLQVADDAARVLEKAVLEGATAPIKVAEFDPERPGFVLVRPDAVASLRVIEVPDSEEQSESLPPIDAQAVADRMRVLGLDGGWELRQRVPVEMGALLPQHAAAAIYGKGGDVPADARRKIAVALGMPEDWLL